MNILSKIGIILVVLFASCSKPAQEEKTRKEAAVQSENQLPVMNITMLNGSSLNIKTLNGKVVLILFQTDCDHCQREAKEIRDNMIAFKDYAIYFITADQMPAIENSEKIMIF